MLSTVLLWREVILNAIYCVAMEREILNVIYCVAMERGDFKCYLLCCYGER